MLEKEIKSAVIGEMLRIAFFVIYYILLIALGVAIICGAFLASYNLLLLLPSVRSIRGIICGVLLIIGLVLFSLMIGLYLIKPLFAFNRNKNAKRVEVRESECPELFAMIREVAEKTACKMPKHVFLSPDVNACVFYNTSFWSIFFPVRKNLEIGLGLFEGTSVEEVKSIIAHEFGHFSQKSMKVGSTVYITNTILHNLIYAEDYWDRLLDKWCLVDTSIIRYFGILTRVLTNIIKRLTFFVYKFVQKGYFKLSRYMEYDADNIACQCVGTENFISAMCKIEILSNKDGLYNSMLNSLLNENKLVSNYFVGNNMVTKLLKETKIPTLRYDEILSKPITTFDIKSRVKIEDVWSSHPSMEDRLENAKQQDCKIDNMGNSIPALSLIPSSISEKVSNNYTSLIRASINGDVSYISDEQLQEWIIKYIAENLMEERFRPFLARRIYQFDMDESIDVPQESPFTEENANKILKLESYINDYNLLRDLKEGRVESRDILVDDVVYNKKNIPLEKIRIDIDVLYNEVIGIYKSIYAYVNNLCAEQQKTLLKVAFDTVFYADYISNKMLPRLFEHRALLLKELNKVVRRDENEYKELCSMVCDYENHLKKVISDLDFEWLSIINNMNYLGNLKKFVEEDHNFHISLNADEINEMFFLTDYMGNMVQNIDHLGRRTLCDISKEVLENQTTLN